MEKMVQKTTAFERFVHLLMAVSGIVLLLTGLGFLYPKELGWLNTLFGGQTIALDIHNWGGVVFAVSIILSLGTLLPESLKWSKEDSQWLGMLGGYLSKDKVTPPQGKLNAGQKIVALSVIVFGIMVSVSGFMMWWTAGDKSIMNLGLLLHSIAFVVFAILMPLHIYMTTAANPGTFRIMTRGDIPLYWAKKKHPKWVKEIGAE
jgi:formate dehydrogenase subunit gamma